MQRQMTRHPVERRWRRFTMAERHARHDPIRGRRMAQGGPMRWVRRRDAGYRRWQMIERGWNIGRGLGRVEADMRLFGRCRAPARQCCGRCGIEGVLRWTFTGGFRRSGLGRGFGQAGALKHDGDGRLGRRRLKHTMRREEQHSEDQRVQDNRNGQRDQPRLWARAANAERYIRRAEA